MMKLPLVAAIMLWPLAIVAEVRYLSADNPQVPADEAIVAVEARVALPEARIGSGRQGAWSLCWGDTAAVTLAFDFRAYVDGIDEPTVTVSCAGRSAVASKGFDCNGGFNTLAVEWGSDGKVRVFGGERALAPLLELDSLPRPHGLLRVLSTVGTPDVADMMVETDPDDFGRLQSTYTDAQLDSATVWRLLDRENDPTIALPGGRYVLAQVGEDLVYLSGAQTNAAHWRRGMLKGRLTPTGYTGYYSLEWFDATGRRLADDCYAQFDSAASTLTLTFPALQASLRFSKF